MPIIKKSTTVLANSQIDNVLSGSQFEFMPYPGRVAFGFCGSAAGLVVDVYSGQDIVCEDTDVNTQNRYPVNPDDYDLVDAADYNERLKVRVRNTTGGNLTFFYGVNITPLG